MKLSASLVTYKHDYESLKKTIDSVLSCPLVESFFIIDNSPEDMLSKDIKDIPQIHYIFNNGNIGFGAGHNIGIKEAIKNNISYHLVINPDVWFEENTIEKLTDYLDTHPEAGLITPKIFYPDGSLQHHCKLLPTPRDWFIRGFSPIKSWKDKINQKFELRFFDYDKIANIPYLNGSFMLFRCKVLEETGPFDENYFMYSEDTDITRRIHRKYQTLFFPEAHIIHAFNQESHRNPKLFYVQIISTIYYFNKYGWFYDKERRRVNKAVIASLKETTNHTLQ